VPDARQCGNDSAFRVFDVRLTWRPDSSKHPTGAAEIESILNRNPGYAVELLQVLLHGRQRPRLRG
jgi:hypothetical protein